MIRSAKVVLLIALLGSVSFAQTAKPQASPPAEGSTEDRASIYFNFAMGRLYGEMAANEGSAVYANRAVRYYQEALKLAPNSPLIADELTDLYLHLNRLQDAVTLGEEMLKKDPDNLSARRILGSVYTRMAQGGRDSEASLQKAIEQYKKITEKDASDSESWATLGDLYRASNKSADAEKAFQAALKADPSNADALKSLAHLYIDQHDLKSAIEKLQAAGEKSPTEETFAEIGLAYSEMGQHKEAVAALQRAAEMAPENDKIAEALADEYERLTPPQLDEAAKIYERLGNGNRREARYPVQLSEIYRLQNDLAKARTLANRAKQLEPDSIAVRLNDAALLEAEGKSDDAVKVYQGLLDDIGRSNSAGDRRKLSDDGRKLKLNILERIAQTYERGHRWNEMSQTLDQAEKIASEDSEKVSVLFMRAAMLERQKQFEASEKVFRKVLDLDPKYAEALNYLGYMLADRNVRLDEAAQLIKQALDLEPDNGAFLDSMGWVCYREGKYAEALGFLERALQRMADPTVHDHLGDVYTKLGRTKDAIAQWQLSLKEAQKPGHTDVDPDEMANVNKKLDDAQAKLARENHN